MSSSSAQERKSSRNYSVLDLKASSLILRILNKSLRRRYCYKDPVRVL